MYDGLQSMEGVRVLGPSSESGEREGLAVAAFTVEGMHHALVAARSSAEFGIGVRHGCFCAHPYLIRLLGVGRAGVNQARVPAAGRPQRDPGRRAGELRARHLRRRRGRAARRAARPGGGRASPVPFVQDEVTGDFWPEGEAAGSSVAERPAGAACARG